MDCTQGEKLMTQPRSKSMQQINIIELIDPHVLKNWIRKGAISFLTLLTGCSTFPTSPVSMQQASRQEASVAAPSPEQLKLGMLFSLSGSLAKYGNPMQDTVKLLIETVNGCGGIAGQAVQLFSEDDQSNPKTGKSSIKHLIERDRVNAVIGAIGSEVSNATVDIAVKNQVVQISPASASPVLTVRAKKGDFKGFWFRTMPPDTFQGEALARLAVQRGFKSVSILTIDNAYGNSIVQTFETTFKKLGGTITSPPIRYRPDVALYDVDLATPFSNQPDAVLMVAEPTLGSEILKAAYEAGFWSGNTKVLLTSSMKTENLAGRVGQSLNGRYIASGVVGVAPRTDSPAMNSFRETYKKRFNREPSLYDPNTWDAAAVIVLAAATTHMATNATTRVPLKEVIAKVANSPGVEVGDVCQALSLIRDGKDINYQGASGTVNFTGTGDVVGSYDVWTIDYTGTIKVEATIQAGEGN